jgi:hypothetical protein
MHASVLTIGVALFLIGLVMALSAQRYRTPQCPPIPSFNVKHWKPIWRMQDWFTPKGYRLHLYGWLIALLGIVIAHVRWYL